MVTAKETTPIEWMTKEQVATYLQISIRQVELQVKAGAIPEPRYLGKLTPRWSKTAIDTALNESKRGAK